MPAKKVSPKKKSATSKTWKSSRSSKSSGKKPVPREKTVEMITRANELYWQSLTWNDIAATLNAEGLTRRDGKTCRDIPSQFAELWDKLNEGHKAKHKAITERNALMQVRELITYQSPIFVPKSAKRQELENALNDVEPEDKAGVLIQLNREDRADAYVRLRAASVALTRLDKLHVELNANTFNFDFSEQEIKEETGRVADALRQLGEDMQRYTKGGNGKSHTEDFTN